MAWKKENGRSFSDVQKRKIIAMVQTGRKKWSIIKEVGCHRSALDFILMQHDKGELKATKGKPITKEELQQVGFGKTVASKTVAAKTHVIVYKEKTNTDTRELVYLRWALHGAMNKVEGASYIDRLIADVRDGRLG